MFWGIHNFQFVAVLGTPYRVFGAVCLVLLALTGLFYLCPGLGRSLKPVREMGRRLARNKRGAVAAVFFIALIARLAILPWEPPGIPQVHDELSYLLQAETFALGRLTNPPHPMAAHLETFHVLQEPTYATKYPPAQSIFMALGIFLGDNPWLGVLLSSALMSAAVCWMLQGWVPPGWALIGGLLSILRFGLFHYWATSFWGGAVAGLGAALVLGAWPRLVRQPKVGDSLLLGLGLAILANSRPYEGLVLALPIGLFLLAWLIRPGRAPLSAKPVRMAVPIVLVLALAGGWMGLYHYRVTGDPLQMPYEAHYQAYQADRVFLWTPKPPDREYRHQVLKDYYLDWFRAHEEPQLTLSGNLKRQYLRVKFFWFNTLVPGLSLPFLLIPLIFRDRRMRPLLIVGLVCAAGTAVKTIVLAHHIAPQFILWFLLTIQALRHLRFLTGRRSKIGPALLKATLTLCLLIPAAHILLTSLGVDFTESKRKWFAEKAALVEKLEARPGKHLILVSYAPDHDIHAEWVYNGPEIDSSKIVWARAMGWEEDRPLLRYFSDRQAWLLLADANPARLKPYPGR